MKQESIKNLEVHTGEGLVKKSEADTFYPVLDSLPRPDVKMKLTASQKYWWYWFGNEFIKTKQVTNLDLMHLQRACFWMDARCKAFAEIKKLGYKGLVQKFQSGATNITGHVSIVEKADKHLDDVSAHFGLSIKDRKKLGVEKPDDNQLSLFEQLMKAKNQKVI